MPTQKAVVIGAGVGGLVTAVQLAARGLQVQVLERASTPGGKMREVAVGASRIDAGPTVLTLREIFESVFADAGARLEDYVRLEPLEIIARHAWSEHERLDLFADHERTVEAIGDFAGAAEADGYRAFCKQARMVYETLNETFIRASRPSFLGLMGRCGLRGFGNLSDIKPYDSLWKILGGYFKDPRLQQLFGRYSTYCGSSPFQAPGTVMLIAHVEQQGVWSVPGGMHQIARALASLAEQHGATIEYDSEVAEILTERGSATGVRLASGEVRQADAVVVNADPAAVANGLFGKAASRAVARVGPSRRSLSAITWCLTAETRGFPLVRHNVFFGGSSAAEFDDVFKHARLPRNGTVYLCAQDRSDQGGAPLSGPERLLLLLNAPPRGDLHSFDAAEIQECEQRVFSHLENCGLQVLRAAEPCLVTTPTKFDRLFPATGGALYGQTTHGWRSPFNRPASRTRIPRLYLAGGSTHPGAGIPMAAMSGRLAAARLIEDLGST
ncbi:phytoene desaturase [Thiorhodococcus mannitoliphagus]|uniref:Phytoene desaturase n=1 Tax=Thiorhodococcus mannitoliphagus TaxID=329406 RepID=A0A6P1DS72_9GAMM|nr:1-hydroxycarotenoid 3,4-desaturase CrtD [Thiorhodococcus mannitoliphagus]NEX20908.1 phytoene desaturase [Thiorhodococcus mannitoliphagus]